MSPEADTPTPETKITPEAITAAAPPMAVATEEPRRRRSRVDLTTGSIPKKLFAQAWPQVIEGVLNIGDHSLIASGQDGWTRVPALSPASA